MSARASLVQRIATLIGISTSYTDAFGNSVDTTPETLLALLDGLGLPTDNEEAARHSLARVERLKSAALPALIPVVAGKAATIKLRKPIPQASVSLTAEDGVPLEGAVLRGDTLQLPPAPMGYYRLVTGEAEATVIAAPARCWEPAALNSGARWWGVTAQIYSLRSKRDLGIGDLSDVALLAESVAARGGAFLGLSPAHALFQADRTKISPYSPSSRLFLEPFYIDPRAVEGFEESGAAKLLDTPAMQETLARLEQAQLIDYADVWSVKRPLLDALWQHFQQSGDQAAFGRFRSERGASLEAHATFEALSEHFREQGRHWMGEWPQEFQSVHGSEVARFRSEHAERVAFHAWLQWVVDQQFADAAATARAAGMPLGLYRDLAVGADSGGSEIWAAPEQFATTLAVGAPPDPLGPQGQNWGLPPFNPLTLEEQGLTAFRELVVANMRHAGAIRIDHAFQLQRLFLIPPEAPASQGAYVDYPFEAMLAVLRLESHRAQCLIIAEDLGTAPEGFSDAIMESGVLSYRVLPFERDGGNFKRPVDYPRPALSVITTHDLPTFTGWWRDLDIDLRQTFGVFDRGTAERQRAERAQDRVAFTRALFQEGLLPSPGTPDTPPLEDAVRFLARSQSALTGLQIEDASGELNQPNMPGLDAGHPNWRRRLAQTIEDIGADGSLLARLAAVMAEEGRDAQERSAALASPPPRATYRLQFHKDFTFDHAVKVIPYLAELGISHVYASPIQAASPGSTHGYDIVDHTAINPELGGEAGFQRFAEALKANGLGLVLDIVPNHMGIGGKENPWWLSVLEWGRRSPVADAFDIDWERPGADGRLIVPFLGQTYGDALEAGELALKFDRDEGSLSVWHWDHRFPLCPTTYPQVLELALPGLDKPQEREELATLIRSLRSLEGEANPSDAAKALKRHLAGMVERSQALGEALDAAVSVTNGVSESRDILHRLLEAQAYRLAYWRVAASDINYRRFFEVNTLAGLRVEIPWVFEKTHELVFRLIDENLIHGLRIDHIDGLADPEGYTRALQRRVGPGFYIVVEKILEPGESLRSWPIAGTSGYDTLNLIDGVLLDNGAEETFESIYRASSDLADPYENLLRQAKVELTQNSFASELEALVADAKAVADASYRTRDYTTFALRQALVDIIAAIPVYRSYIRESGASAEDRDLISRSVAQAKAASPLPDTSVHDFVAVVLLGGGPPMAAADVRRFTRRFQQLTGPVMAKSLEDTLFYRYGRFIALNEVGGDPGHFGLLLPDFHRMAEQQARSWPHAMIATTTHDTKRGEDARARLLALSEMPDEWAAALEQWQALASKAEGAPDANDQVILLQSLLGAWPLDLLEGEDADGLRAFGERMEAYALKALREAKRHSSWVNPDEAYEQSVLSLLKSVLDPDQPFIRKIQPLARRLSFFGMLNGLSRTVLKLTLPGVPDLYQGTEFWDFSLVDPDNRRPVDYALRATGLTTSEPLQALIATWTDGRIKQHLTRALLLNRAQAPELYAFADYAPLAAHGSMAHHVIAYRREHRSGALAVVVPRLWAKLTREGEPVPTTSAWSGTALHLPSGSWRNILTNERVDAGGESMEVGTLFGKLPFAVLRHDNSQAS